MYIQESLNYPMKDLKAMLLGGVLFLFSWLFIPVLPAMGYLVRIMENTVKNIEELPKWENWQDLLVKGLLYLVIFAVYMIVPTIITLALLVLVGGGLAAIGSVLEGSAGLIAAIGSFFILFLVIMVIYMLFGILSTIAVIRYAEKGSIKAGFEIGAVLGKFKKNIVGYIVTTILFVVLFSVAGFILSILSMLLIGVILMPFVFFYLEIVWARVYSTIYRNF